MGLVRNGRAAACAQRTVPRTSLMSVGSGRYFRPRWRAIRRVGFALCAAVKEDRPRRVEAWTGELGSVPDKGAASGVDGKGQETLIVSSCRSHVDSDGAPYGHRYGSD